MTSPEEMGKKPVVHDHRRIDPVTGQVKDTARPRGRHAADRGGVPPTGGDGDTAEAAAGRHAGTDPSDAGDRRTGQPGTGERTTGNQPGNAAEAADVTTEQLATLRAQVAERTADLQRVQAEYANYRKRVDRDRVAVRELAVANVLAELLPVLDAIDRARQHDELSGGFKSVAESLESAVAKLGLVSYGEQGEPFDPKIHEALTHTYSPDVVDVTCVEILQRGYKVGDRILRPARVAVAEPALGPEELGESDAPDAGEPSPRTERDEPSEDAENQAAQDARQPERDD